MIQTPVECLEAAIRAMERSIARLEINRTAIDPEEVALRRKSVILKLQANISAYKKAIKQLQNV